MLAFLLQRLWKGVAEALAFFADNQDSGSEIEVEQAE